MAYCDVLLSKLTDKCTLSGSCDAHDSDYYIFTPMAILVLAHSPLVRILTTEKLHFLSVQDLPGKNQTHFHSLQQDAPDHFALVHPLGLSRALAADYCPSLFGVF